MLINYYYGVLNIKYTRNITENYFLLIGIVTIFACVNVPHIVGNVHTTNLEKEKTLDGPDHSCLIAKL